ncbi:DNA photolyase [Aureococcus anophagefferens]|nr:DNA photolyase [Aureococcus anophagefferens]
MRQLAAEGRMPHLLRQLCAAFLVRDLRVPWRWGAEWFEAHLLDHAPDANYGNWGYRILPVAQLLPLETDHLTRATSSWRTSPRRRAATTCPTATGHTGRARAARDAAAARHMAKIEAVYSANVSAKSVYGERADLYERGHGGEQKAKRLENPKVRAQCSRVPVTEDARKLRAQNRSVVVAVQAFTPSKSNLCEGSRVDWREGVAQCLAKLTGLDVFVRNDDGTCADCARVRRVPCGDVLSKPAGLFVVIGGGDDRQLQFHCAEATAAPAAPVVATTGAHPPTTTSGLRRRRLHEGARALFARAPHLRDGGPAD